jgi:uncharacterized protein YbaR (Trm112 family)
MGCECERKGAVYSGIKEILACPADKQGALVIERCDACKRFHCDEAAAIHYATCKGGTLRYVTRAKRILWTDR